MDSFESYSIPFISKAEMLSDGGNYYVDVIVDFPFIGPHSIQLAFESLDADAFHDMGLWIPNDNTWDDLPLYDLTAKGINCLNIDVQKWFLDRLLSSEHRGYQSIFKSLRNQNELSENWLTIGAQYEEIFSLSQVEPHDEILRLARYVLDELYRRMFKYPELLKNVRWDIVEDIVADVWSRKGYDIIRTARTRDGGVDVICMQSGKRDRSKILIEVKHRKKQIGPSLVRELYGVKCSDPSAETAILVSTSGFSKDALAFARKQAVHNLQLADRQEFLNWINSVKNCEARIPLSESVSKSPWISPLDLSVKLESIMKQKEMGVNYLLELAIMERISLKLQEQLLLEKRTIKNEERKQVEQMIRSFSGKLLDKRTFESRFNIVQNHISALVDKLKWQCILEVESSWTTDKRQMGTKD